MLSEGTFNAYISCRSFICDIYIFVNVSNHTNCTSQTIEAGKERNQTGNHASAASRGRCEVCERRTFIIIHMLYPFVAWPSFLL